MVCIKTIRQTKAKPIFQEEKEFIESKLNISLPNDCWATGGGTKYVYLDIYSKTPYIKFKVHNDGYFELLTNNSEALKDYQQCTVAETVEQERIRLSEMWERDIQRTVQFVTEHKDIPYNISISGGKDSEVLYHLWKEVLARLDFVPEYEFIFFNTTNEVPDVYKYIKSLPDVKIINPDMGWYQYVKEVQKNQLPTIFKRSCCSKYKEGQVRRIYDNNSPRVQVIGMRNKESSKRASYEFFMDYDFDIKLRGNSTMPKLWSKLCPLIDYTTTDIWLTILLYGFAINQRYKYGWSRVGCCICPFSNTYEDKLLQKHYPTFWERFVRLATFCYNNSHILQIEGYTLQEYIDGVWKRPQSKDLQWLKLKPTKENIHKYAEYKGLSDEMAAKFWDKKCKSCGKKTIPIENAMFYRIYGRKEGEEDIRDSICVKCFCKENNISKKEYYEMALEFKEGGCNLF